VVSPSDLYAKCADINERRETLGFFIYFEMYTEDDTYIHTYCTYSFITQNDRTHLHKIKIQVKNTNKSIGNQEWQCAKRLTVHKMFL